MSARIITTVLALIVSLTISSTSQSAEIVVDINTDGTGTSEQCELRDAIAAANSDSEEDGCAAGDGHDRITFGFTGGILLESALPTITESLEIAGPGADSMMIDGDDQYRIFDASFVPGSLIIRGLFLFQGSADNGGCIQAIQTQTMIFEDLRIEACAAVDFNGGGVYFSSGSGSVVTVRRVNLLNNVSLQEGGGMSGFASEMLIEDSLFLANRTDEPGTSGGGLAVGSSDAGMTINRTTFWSNRSPREGAAIRVYNPNTNLVIRHSTISNNEVTENTSFDIGGAISNIGNLSLFNTVVAGNIESNPFHDTADILNTGTGVVSSLGYNLIGNNEGAATTFPPGLQANKDRSGTPGAPIDPKLNALADNGGFTRSAMPMSDSPLVDGGSCPGELQDQRGYGNNSTGLRPIDAPGVPQPDDACDTGAVEYLAEPPDLVYEDGFES